MCSLYPCIDEPSRVPSWTFYYLLSCTGWQRVVGSGSCSSEDPCLLWCLFPGEPSSIPVVTKCFFSCSGPSQDLPPVQQTDHLLSLSGKLCLSFSRQDGAAEGQQPLHGTVLVHIPPQAPPLCLHTSGGLPLPIEDFSAFGEFR